MAINANQVKELREITGAGMMDCKKALEECAGDVDAAVDILRTKGLADLAKRAGRATNEGLVSAWVSDNARVGALVEVNCETDFVALNAEFRTFASVVAEQVAVDSPDGIREGDAALMAQQWKRNPSLTVEQALGELVSKFGENMGVTRFVRYEAVDNGVIGAYIHGPGRIGVIVEIAGADSSRPEVLALAKDVAMHIAAANPICVARESLPATTVEHEMSIYKAQAAESGKPAAMLEKIASGKLEKLFYKQVCLLEQGFVKDPDTSIAQLVAAAAKALGTSLVIAGFDRFVLGEAEPSSE